MHKGKNFSARLFISEQVREQLKYNKVITPIADEVYNSDLKNTKVPREDNYDEQTGSSKRIG